MPVITTCVTLENINACDVWPTLIDFARYPHLMDDVVEVTVSDVASNSMVSAWNVLLNGSEFTWTERDRLHPPFRIEFEQIDGDLETWQGEWTLADNGDDVIATLTIEFDIGIPSLADILNPIGERAIRANSLQMLHAIKDNIVAVAQER
ncbi:type II toxin-antitoxin system RatA family toxin [Erwinia mallotivora]|uniref:type II toxin-antitoxin system RatA family toxin n=1 Tax=Erwinia mallotivora TaxID=69222 RepID=UPI0035EE0E4A